MEESLGKVFNEWDQGVVQIGDICIHTVSTQIPDPPPPGAVS